MVLRSEGRELIDVHLHLGDCLEVLKTLPEGTVNAVVTDPPYEIAIDNHGQENRTRTVIHGDEDMETGLAVLNFADRLGVPTVIFASPRRPWPGDWRNLIVWDKGGAVGGGGDLKTCLKLTWELIQVARNGVINGSRDVSVWRHTVTQKDFANHPCEKPVGLLVKLIEMFTQPGNTVLDPFMGSGSTGVACVKTGRNFIGVEMDPTYYRIAQRRIEQAQQQLSLFQLTVPDLAHAVHDYESTHFSE